MWTAKPGEAGMNVQMQGVFGRLFMCVNVSGKPLGLRGHFHPAGLWISQLCHFDQSVWSLRLKDATTPDRRPSGGGGDVSCLSERRLWNPKKCPPSIRHLNEAGLSAVTGGFNFRSVNILSAWLGSLVFSEASSLRGSLLIAADTTELLRDSTAQNLNEHKGF